MRATTDSREPHVDRSGLCCAACASQDQVLPQIACTLEDDDFKARVEGITQLAARSLLRSGRTPLALHLTYDPQALDEVVDLVAKESTCCPFLDFKVSQDSLGVHLKITAPIKALAAVDDLFAHFAPKLARENA